MAHQAQTYFLDPNSPVAMQLIILHDHAILILSIITTLVIIALLFILTNKYTCRTYLDAQRIETIWTTLPILILISLAYPSLSLLYLRDEITDSAFSVKTIAHQWYWTYEYTAGAKENQSQTLSFDSFIIPIETTSTGSFRLLDVDKRLVLPTKTPIRIIISSADVIHSFTVPSFGVKADAVPGRLNQISFTLIRPGIFYGQCSEICGPNHAFIPIVVEALELNSFKDWYQKIFQI